jgi:hypothetical protein
MLRKIFWPNRDEVTGEWRRLHNGELNDVYLSPNIFRTIKSRKIKLLGVCRTYGEEDRYIQDFVGKTEGKRPLGRPTLRWEDIIKMDWIDLAQDRDSWQIVVNAVMNLQVS